MDELMEMVKTGGYVIVLLGSMIEGESIILTASALASQGFFSIKKIMAIAFVGTLVADQGLFFVGRHYGQSLLGRFPRLNFPAQKAFKLLNRWNTVYILIFRFIYGVRIISPLVIGASGVGIKRFMILNLISAIIWTLISCAAGYLLGEAVMHLITNIHSYQHYVLIGFLGVVVLIAGWAWYRHRRKGVS